MNLWIHPDVIGDLNHVPRKQCEQLLSIIERAVSGLPDPLQEVKPLDRALDGWSAAKPSADVRAFDENEVRAVFRVEDGQATLLALGVRDQVVYGLAIKRRNTQCFIQAKMK